MSFELDPDGTSHLAYPFEQPNWVIVDGSVYHKGDDEHADDWNWGPASDDDEGKMALAMAPGYVIYAGRKASGEPFASYGRQVVVQIVDTTGGRTDMAYRYAHLATLAVEVGDYVHFGSELGTIGGSGQADDSFSPHLHSVFFKNIYETSPASSRNGLANLELGFSPSATLDADSIFAAPFLNDGRPYVTVSEENLPCSTWNGDVNACDAHSILFGGQTSQDCAYYLDTNLCMPRGTSNCRAGIEQDCDEPDAATPCHAFDGDVNACDAHSVLFGNQQTMDCAYYVTTNRCRPRGTPNCLAGILGDCY